jgi:hypothetical protein
MSGVTFSVSYFILRQDTKLPTTATNKLKKRFRKMIGRVAAPLLSHAAHQNREKRIARPLIR